jgi:hypothetical protein
LQSVAMNPALLLDPRGSRKRGIDSHVSLLYLSTALLFPLPFLSCSPGFHPFCFTYTMGTSIPDLGMAGSQASNEAMSSALPTYEQQNVQFLSPGINDDIELDLDLDPSFTDLHATLMAELSGDANPQVNSHTNTIAPNAQHPQFDPSALLNPRSAAKRPASSGGDADRGRADPTIAGQVSLVERLHNVQERTASPAKRVKTEEERKKSAKNPSFRGGSALELQNSNGQAHDQPGPAIDLTMSTSLFSRRALD